DAVHAEGVAERAIIAEIPPYSAAARAIGLAAGIQAVVASPVLAGRNQRVEGEAAPLGRFVPDRMGEPRIELRAVVPAGVAHDAVVVAYGGGERVHPGGRELVGRVGLAELQGAEAARHAEEAVARGERALHFVVLVPGGSLVYRAGSGSRRHIDLGFDLEHELVAAADVVIAAEADVRQVAGNIGLPAELAHRGRIGDALRYV